MEVAERIEIAAELCSFAGRLPGTDAERRAANRLAERLRATGRAAEVEPTYVHPQWGLVHAAHCVLGIAGSLLAVASPAAGLALVAVAAISLYLDLDHRLYLLRTLFFRRASQNVVCRESRPDAPARLVLCAHYDTGRTGWAYAPRRARRVARWAQGRLRLGPFRIVFWSLAALAALLGARLAGAGADPISILQLPPTLILVGAAFLLVEIELSAPAPGANDNASGVATVLSLAAELGADRPRNLELWVLLTGGEDCQQEGMRAFLRAHREELRRKPTLFACVTAVGRGEVRYETAAGWVVGHRLDRRAIELCEAIAAADREGPSRYGAAPLAHGLGSDAVPPRIRGLRSIGVTCRDRDGYAVGIHLSADTPDRLDPTALERAHGFLSELVAALDRDAGRAAGRAESATAER